MLNKIILIVVIIFISFINVNGETNFELVYDSPDQITIRSLYEFDGYIYAGTYDKGYILRSYDGIDWSQVYDSDNEIVSFCEFENKLYAGCSPYGKIVCSSDGINWSICYDTSETHIMDMEVFDGYLYASSGLDGNIYRTNDGNIWVEIFTNVTPQPINTLKTFNNAIYAGTGTNGIIYKSYDGLIWDIVFYGRFNVAPNINTLEVLKDNIYAGTGNSGRIFKSHDGNVWSPVIITGFYNRIYSLYTYDNCMYVGVYDCGTLYKTYDGYNYQVACETNEDVIFTITSHKDYIYFGTKPNGLIYRSYVGYDYSITIQSNEFYNVNDKISIYKNDKFMFTSSYNEHILLDNNSNYTFLLHEDVLDTVTNIENLPTHINNNSSLLMYIIIVFAFIGLIVYLIRRF